MEEQTTALISTLKPTVVVEPQLVPEEGKDFEWPLFYSERRDAETVVYRHRQTDKEQFVDHGGHIQITTMDPAEQAHSIKAAVQIATDRGWREIEVTGTEEFRRQVWIEASLSGIQCKGYTPSPEDVAELEKLRPGSSPAPAELEPAKIAPASTETQVSLTEEQERFRSTLFPNLSFDEYLAMERKMQSDYQARPADEQVRMADTVKRIGEQTVRVGSQRDVADAMSLAKEGEKGEEAKKELSPEARERRIHELKAKFADNQTRIDAATERMKSQPGNGRSAPTPRGQER